MPTKNIHGLTPKQFKRKVTRQRQATAQNLGALEGEAEADAKKKELEDAKQALLTEQAKRFAIEGLPINPEETFLAASIEKDDGGAADMGTVAVSSDPGVFTPTYGAKKDKLLHRRSSGSKKNKSGPAKLDDFLNNSFKSLDDETFLVELIHHVGDELRKAGEGPHGTYTPYNERPYQPPFPQETKAKKRGGDEEVNRSPTTENTVPVTIGAGALGNSSIPKETVMAEVGVDDARNMNRPVARKNKDKRSQSLPTGAYLNPGDESGNNFQDTNVAFTAMQKMPTHGNTTANTPKQFSTQRPQEPFIERKPRLDPNSDVEQNEFVNNVKGIDDEDKAKKGKSYETNKESNNIASTNITQYSVHGGSPLQLSSTNMPVGLDSLKRDSDDTITEPDEEGSTEEMLDIPEENEEIKAEKSAVQKMLDWLHEV